MATPPVFFPGESHGQKNVVATVHKVTKNWHDWATNTYRGILDMVTHSDKVFESVIAKSKRIYCEARGEVNIKNRWTLHHIFKDYKILQ